MGRNFSRPSKELDFRLKLEERTVRVMTVGFRFPRTFAPGAKLAAIALLCLLVLSPLGSVSAISPTPQGNLLSDDFEHDTSLNTSLWQINGPVGTQFAANNCPSCALIPLNPSFSSAGMEIADADANSVIGTIQSTASFVPPFTVTALVEGTVSNGHTFVFGISSAAGTAGVQVTGNLDPRDCSSESNCGNPATCGNSANPSIASGQCFYGIYDRFGSNGGNWKKSPPLNYSPSLDVVYTLGISVDSSGNAQWNVSQGGEVLGSSSGQVGTENFTIVLAQSEGVPVPGPGPNQAYWLSVTVTPSAPPVSTPSSSSTLADWLLIVVVAVVIVFALLFVVANNRRRHLTVTVLDSGSLAPIPDAGVWANGPKRYSGSTGGNGSVGFGGVKAGDYSIEARATGYVNSAPVTIRVNRAAKHTVRLDHAVRSAPAVTEVGAPPTGPNPIAVVPPPGPAPTAGPGSVGTVRPVEPALVPPPPSVPEATEGWVGMRIQEIIQTFRSQGAVSPETALTAEELGLSRMFVRIMRRRRGQTRIFIEIDGRYYLDEKALQERR